MKAFTTKIPGVKLFAYIVKEARGVKSKFYFFICSPTGPLALTALLNPKKAGGWLEEPPPADNRLPFLGG